MSSMSNTCKHNLCRLILYFIYSEELRFAYGALDVSLFVLVQRAAAILCFQFVAGFSLTFFFVMLYNGFAPQVDVLFHVNGIQERKNR